MRVGFAQGEKIQVWRFPGVIKVLVSNDGSRVAAQSTSGEVGRLVGREIRVYDVVHAKELGAVLIGPKDFNYGNESDLADTQSFSPHGEHLLVKHLTKGEALVECWNVRDVPRLEWKKPGEGVLAMRWVEHEIVVLTKREVQHWDEKGTMSERVPLQGVRFDEGTTAAISEDGALVAAGDDRAFVVDARTGKLQRELPLPGAAFRLEFSPDEKYLLSNGEKLDLDAGGAPIGQTATFSLFRLSDGKQLWKDPLPTQLAPSSPATVERCGNLTANSSGTSKPKSSLRTQ